MKSIAIRTLCLLLLVLTLALSLVACRDTDEDLPENMQYATVEGAYYRLFAPIDWNLMTEMGISGAYASAQNRAIIFAHEYDNADALDAKAYAEHYMATEIAAAYPDEGLTFATSDTVLDGKAAVMIEYSATRDLITYRTRELVCVVGDRAYVLTYAAQFDLFEGYLPVYDSVAASFLFKDEPYAPEKPVHTVDTDADAPAGMKLASNDDVAYRFYVPEGWVLDTALPTSSVYFSEDDRSNVNVTVYMPEVDRMSAEEYWALCEAEYARAMDDYTLVSTTATTLDTRPANTYIYTATVDGTAFRFAQTVASYRGMVYTVTYTALPEVFDTHMTDYERMLAAFDFRGN